MKRRKEKRPAVGEPTINIADVTTIAGTLAGAAVGAVAGPTGMLIGTAVGAEVGMAAGMMLEEDTQRAHRHTEDLDKEIGINGGSLGTTRKMRKIRRERA